MTTKWINEGECMNIKNPLKIIMMNQNGSNKKIIVFPTILIHSLFDLYNL